MTRVQFPSYGLDVAEIKNGFVDSSVGIVLRGQRMPVAAYKLGMRIRDAKSARVPIENDGSRSQVSLLQDAGVEVRTDAIGDRWFIDHLPPPDSYLVLK